MFQDAVSVVLEGTCEDSYFEVTLQTTQKIEKIWSEQELTLGGTDYSIVHQSFIEVQQQSVSTRRRMVQIWRRAGFQELNAPAMPLLPNQPTRIELQQVVIQQISRKSLQTIELIAHKALQFDELTRKAANSFGDAIPDRKERERGERRSVLAQVFVVVGLKEGTQGFFPGCLEERTVEVSEISAQLVPLGLVGLEFVSDKAFHQQNQRHTLIVYHLLYRHPRSFLACSCLQLAQITLLLQHVCLHCLHHSSCLLSPHDCSDHPGQSKHVVRQVLGLGRSHLFAEWHFFQLLVQFAHNTERVFGGSKQSRWAFLGPLACFEVLAQLILSKKLIFLARVLLAGGMPPAPAERKWKDGRTLLVCLSLEASRFGKQVLQIWILHALGSEQFEILLRYRAQFEPIASTHHQTNQKYNKNTFPLCRKYNQLSTHSFLLPDSSYSYF